MEFQIKVENLRSALRITQRAMDRNDLSSARCFFHISLADDNNISVLAGGQLFSVKFKAKIESVKDKDKPFLLNYKIMKYLDRLDSDEIITVKSVDNKVAKVRSSCGVVSYTSYPVEEYPLPKEPEENLIKTSYPVNINDFSKVIDFVSNDNLRPILETIYIKSSNSKTNIIATDGHSIAKVSEEAETEEGKDLSILIPKRVAQFIVSEDLSVNVSESNGNIILETDNKKMMLQFGKLNSTYPNVEAVFTRMMPKYKVIVPTEKLMNSILRLQTLGERCFNIKIRKDDIILRTQDMFNNILTEQIKRDESDDREGWTEDVDIVIAISVFDKSIKHISEEKTAIMYTNSSSAVLIKGLEKESPVYLTSPYLE